MKIHFLGVHNCESQQARLLSLLIDDCLALDAGGLTSGLSFEAQLRLKAVLLSHQHYDHIRDIPLLAMHFYLNNADIDIYAPPSVSDALAASFLNGELYPRFLEKPEDRPTLRFHAIEPYHPFQVEAYDILAVPLSHSVPTVGYQITSATGKKIFYTGDTGPGLEHCWQHVSPELLIIEVTASNRFTEFGRESGHLTPGLLREELLGFQKVKSYLPKVLTVHMNPNLEKEIEAEIAALAGELDCSIALAYEGMQLKL